jgi:membrane-bound serine protease (ClpP class)
MAPATNLGAATPVQVGGGLPGIGGGTAPDSGKDQGEPDQASAGGTMEHKLVNDAVAYIRGLAELRGRNADWAEDAVRNSVSLSSGAALKNQVIDLVAEDVPGLIKAIDGRTVRVAGAERTLNTAGIRVRELEPDWRVRLLSVIANPNVAYILLIVGIYGIVFELWSPGAMLPGVVGAVSLLLALYALQLLPVNYAGLALILLGMGLMIAEAFVPSFGALGLGGLAAFIFGSVVLMQGSEIGIAIPLIGVTGLLSAAFSVWVLGRLLGLRRRISVAGTEHLVGGQGEAVEDFEGLGRIRIEGEIWQARATGPVHRGERVRVIRVDGLRLDVEPMKQE